MPVTIMKRAAEQDPDLAVVQQIDELERIATEARDRELGDGWFDEVKSFYGITQAPSAAPTFRPQVTIPKLQARMLNEATDLSDQSPQIFLIRDGKRDRKLEKAFGEHWREEYFNNKLFLAELWSLYAGTGFIQVGFDPWAKRGRGQVWMDVRDPSTVYPDPADTDPDRWVFCLLKDRMYLDEIRRLWPEKGRALKAPATNGSQYGADNMGFGLGLHLPDGPLSVYGRLPHEKLGPDDGRLEVRHVYIRDYTSVEIPKEDRERLREYLHGMVPSPGRKLKWPNGRWLVECNGSILADGDNPTPCRKFPLIPYHSMPMLGSFWCPPPVRYTKNLQELAQKQYTQNYENAVRLNNGIWFIDDRTGIQADEFGGLPAQVVIINANSPIPEQKFPQAMPAHMMQMPRELLSLQDDVQGFTAARQGEQSKGNVSVALQDSTIFQGQYLTRMRSRFMAEAIQDTAELVFHTMVRNLKGGTQFMAADSEKSEPQIWPQIIDPEAYDVRLDQTSIRPVSGAAMRQLVLGLLEKGHLPLQYALEALEFPDAEEIAAVQRKELEVAALSKLKRPR